MRLTFFTTNAGKLAEASALLGPLGVDVVGDGRGYPEVQADSLQAVTEGGADALLRAGAKPPFLLEDSGLFVPALGGFPGVYSAYVMRTLGIAGLLRLLEGRTGDDRRAEFRADALLVDGAVTRHHFEGTCAGRIAAAPRGSGGFGYDPVFVPAAASGASQDLTFAELGPTGKGAVSHRGAALRALARHLEQTAKA